MKKILKIGIGMMLMSVFVFTPAISYAQLGVSADLYGNTTGNVDGVLDTNIDTGVDASTNIDTSVDTDTGIDVDSDSGMKIDVGSDSEIDNESGTNAESNTEGTLRVNASGIAITSPSQVKSDVDLEVFSVNASKQKEDVEKVEIESENNGESKVEVVYKHRGRLFGLIPVTVKSTTIVESNANEEAKVETKKSWYAFLVSGENYSKAEVESRVKNNSTVKANAKVNASADAKARVAEAVIAELEAYAQGSANTQTSING